MIQAGLPMEMFDISWNGKPNLKSTLQAIQATQAIPGLYQTTKPPSHPSHPSYQIAMPPSSPRKLGVTKNRDTTEVGLVFLDSRE